jgi:uncharacterized protein YbaA (DUF1428 family)
MTTAPTPYVDGFVASVPSTDREAYLAHCRASATIFTDHGATRVFDSWGDDVPRGKLTDFYMAVKAEAEETVVFGWIEWPSKAVRDAGWAAVMADPRMAPGANPIPFDGKRMIYGGFAPIHDARA